MGLFALGGAIFGSTVGFFYGFAVRLPTSPEAFDTFAEDPAAVSGPAGGPQGHWIAVEAAPPTTERAAAVMQSHGPEKLVST
ncbi:MAG: hypothetical protein R2716_07270 [Microthrixaceae bacterium]